MIEIPARDANLETLVGATLPSPTNRTVVYQIERHLGTGGMGSAFFAQRYTGSGQAPAVIKVLHPGFVAESRGTAQLAVQKEVASLQRLNARVPSTPFVVRYHDTGTLAVRFAGTTMEIPWIGLEYVHGGPEGTTLTARVAHSIKATGFAFDRERAARTIECLSEGITAVHDVGVIHRDLKPDNVLCCGFGMDEIFKITDFGVARPVGMAATFGSGRSVGTPGYAAPEQWSGKQEELGPNSDVFAFACLAYYLLSGEELFQGDSIPDVLVQMRQPRRSLKRAAYLSPDIKDQPHLIASLDLAIARGTALVAGERPPTADLFASSLSVPLTSAPSTTRVPSRSAEMLAGTLVGNTAGGGWTWTALERGGGSRVVRSVAWDSDGRCLAASNEGPMFWDGSSWSLIKLGSFEGAAVRFVQRTGPGRWIAGGDDMTFGAFASDGFGDLVRGPDPRAHFTAASGEPTDLAVFAAEASGTWPLLYGFTSRRWMRPVPVEGITSINGIARLDDERFVFVGRSASGGGVLGIFWPLHWHIEWVPTPTVPAFLSVAAMPDQHTGVAGGAMGALVHLSKAGVFTEKLTVDTAVSAVSVDPAGSAWAATPGAVWLREGVMEHATWNPVWSNPQWRTPFVSLYTSPGHVLAVTADGAILEGRLG
jgi:eukaryotic-like serine/threonine-protein kinase